MYSTSTHLYVCELTYTHDLETIQMPINRELVRWLHIMEYQVLTKKLVSSLVIWKTAGKKLSKKGKQYVYDATLCKNEKKIRVYIFICLYMHKSMDGNIRNRERV